MARPEAAVFLAVSLDGFIARPDDGLDWLPSAPEGEDFGYAAFMESVDVLVMGRRTYDVVRSFGDWPYTKRVVVLSHRPLDGPEGAEVERAEGDPAEVIARLGGEGVGRVYVDGGETVRQFLRAGLVGEMTLTVVPVLLGEGIPLFGETGEVPLDLIESRTLPRGLVQSRYRVG